jgi:hypothetical protein
VRIDSPRASHSWPLKSHAIDQVLEAGIGTDRIKRRLTEEIDKVAVSGRETLFQQFKSLFPIT